MESVFFQPVLCPYCGETIEMEVDSSAGEQAYIEDCAVCCRPIEVQLQREGTEWRVAVQRDDD